MYVCMYVCMYAYLTGEYVHNNFLNTSDCNANKILSVYMHVSIYICMYVCMDVVHNIYR